MSRFCQRCKCRLGKCAIWVFFCFFLTIPALLAATSVASTRVALRAKTLDLKRAFSTSHLRDGWSRASCLSSRLSRFLTNLFLMLLYYYDYYGCFFNYYHYYESILFFRSCSGTDSWLSLCGKEIAWWAIVCFRRPGKLITAEISTWNLEFAWMNTIFSFFSIIICHSFVFLPVREGKTSVFVAVRERLVFILSSFMVPICTILKVLILVYMQNTPVLQQKTCYKDKNKKMTASHLYFLNIVLLLYYVLQSPKRKKKQKNFEINSLFIKQYDKWVRIQWMIDFITDFDIWHTCVKYCSSFKALLHR